jgi:hypothetical protein
MNKLIAAVDFSVTVRSSTRDWLPKNLEIAFLVQQVPHYHSGMCFTIVMWKSVEGYGQSTIGISVTSEDISARLVGHQGNHCHRP